MAKSSKRERSREAARDAVAQAGALRRDADEAGTLHGEPDEDRVASAPARRTQDPFTGELRRRAVLPLLVLHLISQGPTYGNQLMERIAAMTAGVLSVNPNTMYPLLRRLESSGLIRGQWEHPERRTRRYYSLTDEGRSEYERLVGEVRPFLDSVRSSIDEIVHEVYGG
jgi:PadR family transcriptional regulator PadR